MSAFARDFGPVVRGRFGTLLVHLVTGPDAVRHILQENARNYDKNTDDYDLLSLALGKGLVTSEGELWRRQRRIAQPAFHRERIAGFAEKMSDAVSQMLRQWDRQGVDGQAIDVAERMTMLTQEIVAATLFGSEVSSADATRFA